MPSFILKTAPDENLYVEWSTIVDAPISWGSREQMKSWGVGEDRLARADQYGTSMCDPALPFDQQWFGWSDDGMIYDQQGWLPRHRLGDLVVRLSHEEDVSDLLEPFED